MKIITQQDLLQVLLDVGIRSGDGLLVHSAVQFLGQPSGGPEMYLETILDLIGPRGTLAVPAFNFAFARGFPYDPLKTPSEGMGVFSEIVRCHADARRTLHPMQSLAVIGCHRDDLTRRDTLSAFDPGSAFERMLELDFKLLLLGADVYAASIIHYSEQRLGVPYRYWKSFTGQVIQSGRPSTLICRMFVRDMNLNPRLNLKPVEGRLRQQDLWIEKSLNYGRVAVCRLTDFVKAADNLLMSDPWVLVANRPGSIHG